MSPPGGVSGVVIGLVCVLLVLGGLVVAVLTLQRSGDAVDRVLDGRRTAWAAVILWGLLGWSACAAGAGVIVWWLGGARLP